MAFVEKFIIPVDSKLLSRAKCTPCKTCVHFIKKDETCSRFVYINPVTGKTSFPNALVVRDDTFCGFGGKYYQQMSATDLKKVKCGECDKKKIDIIDQTPDSGDDYKSYEDTIVSGVYCSVKCIPDTYTTD